MLEKTPYAYGRTATFKGNESLLFITSANSAIFMYSVAYDVDYTCIDINCSELIKVYKVERQLRYYRVGIWLTKST
jgi:hypothetical protein